MLYQWKSRKHLRSAGAADRDGIILRTRPCRALTDRVRETGGGGGGRAREAGGGGGVFAFLAGFRGRENGVDQGFCRRGSVGGCALFALVFKKRVDRRNARRRFRQAGNCSTSTGSIPPRRCQTPVRTSRGLGIGVESAAFRPVAARRRSGRLSGAPPFLVPASVVPVPAQVRFVLGHDQQMEPALGYDPPAPRTQVGLGGRLRLDMADGQPPRNAHATRAAVRMSAPATRKMSAARRRCLRNGLNPMPRCYRRHAAGRRGGGSGEGCPHSGRREAGLSITRVLIDT